MKKHWNVLFSTKPVKVQENVPRNRTKINCVKLVDINWTERYVVLFVKNRQRPILWILFQKQKKINKFSFFFWSLCFMFYLVSVTDKWRMYSNKIVTIKYLFKFLTKTYIGPKISNENLDQEQNKHFRLDFFLFLSFSKTKFLFDSQ